MSSLAQDLIDELVVDLDTNGNLPSHKTVPYRRPRVIMPEDCPLMVVWLVTKDPTGVTNAEFHGNITLGISWHEETVEEAETLINDPATAIALMDAQSKIEARLRALAVAGLAATWELTPGPSTYLSADMSDGLVEGYLLTATARVTEGI